MAPELSPLLAQLAANLLALRARGNWTSSALAEQAHVSRRMVQSMEKARVNASLHAGDKTARALGVKTGSLLGKKPLPRQDGDALIDQVLAQNLVATRMRLSLTQEQLSQRSGVSRAVIAHIERQARNPSLQTLARLATSLDLSIEALLSK